MNQQNNNNDDTYQLKRISERIIPLKDSLSLSLSLFILLILHYEAGNTPAELTFHLLLCSELPVSPRRRGPCQLQLTVLRPAVIKMSPRPSPATHQRCPSLLLHSGHVGRFCQRRGQKCSCMTTRLKPSRRCWEIRKSRCDSLGEVYLVTGEQVSAALKQTSAFILVFPLEPQSYFAGKKAF